MIKQQTNKDGVYQYIVQTHQNTLKQYLELAPRITPKQETYKEEHLPVYVLSPIINHTRNTNS